MPDTTTKIVKLQVNQAGAWRNVMDFDCADDDDAEHIMQKASDLFQWDSNRDRVGLRIIMPGETAPLMNWTYKDGWREWRAA